MLGSNEYFKVRLKGGGYYISWRENDKPRQVENTPMFAVFSDAKEYLRDNWKSLLDQEFEREVLIGSK